MRVYFSFAFLSEILLAVINCLIPPRPVEANLLLVGRVREDEGSRVVIDANLLYSPLRSLSGVLLRHSPRVNQPHPVKQPAREAELGRAVARGGVRIKWRFFVSVLVRYMHCRP